MAVLSADQLFATRADTAAERMLGEAVARTVAYSDIFDCPLTIDEIFRYLEIAGATKETAAEAAVRACEANGPLCRDGDLFALVGRAEVFATRRRRRKIAAREWPRARFWARLIWAIPHVRMVAVTGSLAAGNVDSGADIDFLIVTDPGHLWTARAAAVAVCRLARLRGVRLCPNYLVTSTSLRLAPETLYGAHELAQMTVIYGVEAARALVEDNQWALAFLPNIEVQAGKDKPFPVILEMMKRLGEAVLRTRYGTRIEQWAWRRKVSQVTGLALGEEERYAPDVCKGHQHRHAARTLSAFSRRLEMVSSWRAAEGGD